MLLPNTSRKRVSWDFRCVAKAVCPRSLRGSVRCQSAEARARPAQPLCMLQLNIGCNTVGQDSVGWRQESEPTQHHVSVACDPGTRPKNLKNGVRLMHSRLNANKPAHGDFMRRCQHKLVDWPLTFAPSAKSARARSRTQLQSQMLSPSLAFSTVGPDRTAAVPSEGPEWRGIETCRFHLLPPVRLSANTCARRAM